MRRRREGSALRAAGFKAVKDGKVQVILLSQGLMSVTGRGGNCKGSDSSGKAPNVGLVPYQGTQPIGFAVPSLLQARLWGS